MQDSRTGDAEVDRMLERLDDLSARPVVEHVQVVEQVHRELEAHLAGQDEG